MPASIGVCSHICRRESPTPKKKRNFQPDAVGRDDAYVDAVGVELSCIDYRVAWAVFLFYDECVALGSTLTGWPIAKQF